MKSLGETFIFVFFRRSSKHVYHFLRCITQNRVYLIFIRGLLVVLFFCLKLETLQSLCSTEGWSINSFQCSFDGIFHKARHPISQMKIISHSFPISMASSCLCLFCIRANYFFCTSGSLFLYPLLRNLTLIKASSICPIFFVIEKDTTKPLNFN